MRQIATDKLDMKISGGVKVPPSLRPFDRPRTKFPLCGDALRRLANFNPGVKIDPGIIRTINDRDRELAEAAAAAHDLSELPDEPRLLPHQRGGVRWLRRMRRGILADDRGLGKTVQALVAARDLGSSCVVVCHSIKRDDWIEHIRDWTNFAPRQVEASDHVEGSIQGEALVMTFEAAVRHSRILKPQVLIIDEAHHLRNRKAKHHFSNLRILARRSACLFLLTADPIVNHSWDIWALLHLVDHRRFGGFWDFATRFMEIRPGAHGIKVGDVRPEEEENFEDLIGSYVLQRRKDESTMPELDRMTSPLLMHGSWRALYDAMLSGSRAEYDGVEVEAIEAVAWITRLRQIAISPRLIWPTYTGLDKFRGLENLMRGFVGQSVIFTQFAQAAQIAAEVVPGCVALVGDLGARERERVLAAFDAGEIRCLATTFDLGGEGLNLVAASRVVLLDLAWHPTGNRQARDRVWRYGQRAERVEVIYLRTRDSIEDLVLDTLRRKQPVTVEGLTERLASRQAT